ncbi:MAG: PDZ domain-containing protein, partial [Clostridia bacterium]|nr:PDZ domain-containing protein [Clostridia bacterium]
FGVTDGEFLDALILKILEEKDDDEAFEFLADSLTSALDEHSVYFTPEELNSFNEYVDGAFGGIGVSMVLIDGYCTVAEVLPDTPATKVDISTGDKIIAVNGESVINYDIDLIVSKVRGEVGTDVTLTLQSDTRTWDVVITRAVVSVDSVSHIINDNGDAAYMVIARFGGETANEFIENYNQIKEKGINKIVIDLRDNTGGYTEQAEKIASIFLPADAIIYSENSRAYDLKIPFYSLNENPDLETELVIVVNEYTASSSEILTGALKDNNRAKVVGTKTFGKGTVQTVTSLGNYGSLKTTIA